MLGCAERVQPRRLVVSAEHHIQLHDHDRRTNPLGARRDQEQVSEVARTVGAGMTFHRLLLAGAALLLAPLGVITLVQARSAGHQPDAKHGAVIVAQGTAAGAPPCAQCHAFNGVSDASGAFPRLAGQSAYYLAGQLRDFASGVRASAIMSPIAKALSPDDIADVTAYFAGVNAPFLPLKAPNPALVKRGEELAKAGGPERLHCDNCHGAGGSGEPPVIPYLAGQYAHYIAFTLQMWQEGFRKNSPDAMEAIAKKLDDQEILAVAAYYQQVPSTRSTAGSQGKD